MISHRVLDRIRSIYADCLRFDDFESRNADSEADKALYGSLRSLLQDLCKLAATSSNSAGVRLPPLTNLDMTLREFMTMPYVQRDGRAMTLGAVLFAQFCRNRVSMVLEEMFLLSTEAELIDQALPVQGIAAHTLDELRQHLAEPAAQREIALALMADLEQAWCRRTLRSFFMAQANAQGYMAWWPESKIGNGKLLPTAAIATASGTVQNAVTRCEAQQDEQQQERVAAYEWCAELRGNPASAAPDAIAYGMAYVFERDSEGLPLGTVDDLVCASDAVSDVDVLQVDAMLAQHGDTPEIILGSDLAFVWLWERRLGSARGLGAECLKAALQDLVARFPAIRTLAINMKPAQFKSWDEGEDPPGIVLAKQEAIDAVHAYIGQARLDDIVRGEVRLIVSNQDPDADRAAQVVAQAAARRLIRQVGRA